MAWTAENAFPYTRKVENDRLAERMADPRLGPESAVPIVGRSLSVARSQVHQVLADLGGWQRLSAIAEAAGLHANTVREHLETLVDAGLVGRRRADPEGRGRPAWLYRSAEPAAEPVGAEYAALASVLIEHIAATSSDPATEARAAGVSWGHRIVDQAEGAEAESSAEVVVDVLRRLHFRPKPNQDGSRVDLFSCPILDAARAHPEVVCAVHLGIIEGVLAAEGVADSERADLVPFAGPGYCRLTLHARAAAKA